MPAPLGGLFGGEGGPACRGNPVGVPLARFGFRNLSPARTTYYRQKIKVNIKGITLQV